MLGTIYAVAVLSSIVFVILPGWALREIATGIGLRFRRTGAAAYLTPFAFGVHFNALWFLVAWVFFSKATKPHLLALTVLLDLALVVAGIVISFSKAGRRSARQPVYITVVIVFGAVIGSFAFIQFPNVLDSIEILQLQHFIFGTGWSAVDAATLGWPARVVGVLRGSIPCPPMPGFAGIMLVPTVLLKSVPVATVAAGMKILLGVIASLAVTHLAERLNLRPRVPAIVILLSGLLFSRFGMYGLVNLGKDSIFSVPMFVAAIASLVGDRNGRHRNETNLYFSAAIFLGSVVVPYGLIFWAIYAILSLKQSRLPRDLLSLCCWTIVALPVAVAGIHTTLDSGDSKHAPLIVLVLAQALAAIFLAWWARRTVSKKRDVDIAVIFAFIPLLGYGLCILLMPALAHIITWVDAFGHQTVEIRQPLDGSTNFFAYFFRSYGENLRGIIMVGTVGSIALPFLGRRFRNPAALAMLGFLPATLAVVLLHLKLGLHSLTDFNIWDISKNIPQWFVGMISAAFSLLFLESVLRPMSRVIPMMFWGRARYIRVIPIALMVVFMLVGFKRADFRDSFTQDLLSRPTYTSIGGFADSDSARAMEFVWKKARNGTVFITPGSAFDGAFYSYQMFGASSTYRFDSRLLDSNFSQQYPRVTFLVDANDMVRILAFARASNASIDASVTENHLFMLAVKFDGRGVVAGQGLNDAFVSLESTAYPVEYMGDSAFRWLGKEVDLTIFAPLMRDRVCIKVDLVNPTAEVKTVTISGSDNRQVLSLSPRQNLGSPLSASTCASLVDGRAIIHLSTSGTDHPFPDDSRKIGVGLMWPPQVQK
jgi:hypothetical protein